MNKKSFTVSYCHKCKAFCLTTHANEKHFYNVKYRWDGRGYQWVNDEMYDSEGISEECPKCQTEVSSVGVSSGVAEMLVDDTLLDADILPISIDEDAFVIGPELFDDTTLVKKAIAQLKLKE